MEERDKPLPLVPKGNCWPGGQNGRVTSHPPQVRPVLDATSPELSDYVRLRDASLRRHLESERGLFIAEGEKVIRRAVQFGHRPRSFLLAERWLEPLGDVWVQWPDVPVYVVTEQLAEAVTGFHVHRGALASMHRELRHTAADLLGRRRIVVLEDVVDHTNVGAILRCAAGLGWDGALLAPRAADPLYRRAVKVSMGAVFSLPWARLDDWYESPQILRRAGFLTVAMTLSDDALPLERVADIVRSSGRPVAVLVGTEGAGLSDHWTRSAELRAVIPMQAGVDSLNVAAATAIACYSLGETGQSAG
jgi:tRNA G18 (ribose-2'-O)-methylase SpoU